MAWRVAERAPLYGGDREFGCWRFQTISKRHLDSPPAPVTVRDDLPNPKAGHTWKFIAFGPDDMLYMSVGGSVQRLPVVAHGVGLSCG